MLTKNYLSIFNSYTQSLPTLVEPLKDFSGNNITTNTSVNFSYHSLCNYCLSSAVIATSEESVNSQKLFISIGKRDTAPTPDTYAPVFTPNVTLNAVGGNYTNTVLTVKNNGTSSIEFNEVDVMAGFNSSGVKTLIAVFPLDETMTIEPGGHFSFSLINE